MSNFAIPTEFINNRIAAMGSGARPWIDSLPSLIEQLCQRWNLRVDPQRPMHGWSNLVVPVHRETEPLILRIGHDSVEAATESRALRAWDGQGVVRLIDAVESDNALLLERVDSSRTLEHVELHVAAQVAGSLIQRLAVDPSDEFPALADVASKMTQNIESRQNRLGRPVPNMWVASAIEIAHDFGNSTMNRMVHADLHYGNILGAKREPWLSIDPRPVIGDPEFSVPELMWTRGDELSNANEVKLHLSAIVDAGGIDASRATGWWIARSVDYWLWGLDRGLTEDPDRCRHILQALLPLC